MARQVVGKVLRLSGFIGAVLLLCLLLSSPVSANTLAISPSVVELEVLPGTTARVVFSVENRSNNSYFFNFWPAHPSLARENYTNFPNLSWLSLDPKDIKIAGGERGWVTVTISIPNDQNLAGQRWQANIDFAHDEELPFTGSVTILVSVSKESPEGTNWGITSSIITASIIVAVIWNRWKEKRRAKWTTGLRTKHWLE